MLDKINSAQPTLITLTESSSPVCKYTWDTRKEAIGIGPDLQNSSRQSTFAYAHMVSVFHAVSTLNFYPIASVSWLQFLIQSLRFTTPLASTFTSAPFSVQNLWHFPSAPTLRFWIRITSQVKVYLTPLDRLTNSMTPIQCCSRARR